MADTTELDPRNLGLALESAPQSVVDFVLGQIRKAEGVPAILSEEWERTSSHPALRARLSQISFGLAPNDLHQRGVAMNSMLSLLAIEDVAALATRVDGAFAEQSDYDQLQINFLPAVA